MTRLLVDNSVLSRIRQDAVIAELRSLAGAGHEMCSSMISLAEAGFSARSVADHDELIERLKYGWLYLESGPLVDELAIDIRRALHARGHNRAVGAMDCLLAATAFSHRATVLHYDADFDLIADAFPGFSARWVVPRGTTD